MKKLLFLTAILCSFAAVGFAQPRPMEKPATKPAVKSPSPSSVAAKYEGGMYGFSERVDGTLKLDDANSRLVFYGKDEKEKFGIPYDALLVIYPQSKSVTSTTGNVVKNVPLPGAGLAGSNGPAAGEGRGPALPRLSTGIARRGAAPVG